MEPTDSIPPPPVHQPSSGQIRYQALTAASRVHQGLISLASAGFIPYAETSREEVLHTARAFEAYLRGDQ